MNTPRPYQADAQADAYAQWGAGERNVVIVLPTGGGKTFIFARILRDHGGASCAIAHRQELVSQISLALASDGVQHRIIGPKAVTKLCVGQHMSELGKSFVNPQARCAVAGVDTLIRRKAALGNWLSTVTLWVMDEGHHILAANKWGKAAEMFPNARGLAVTATPLRADRKGLGRAYDGLLDVLVTGPNVRDLIRMGYLTDYRIFAPQSDIDLQDVAVSQATGDFTHQSLVRAVRQSHIVGDVVAEYVKLARGKLGVTFVTDVETARNVAAKFVGQGIPAEMVCAETPDSERIAAMKRFKRRETLQLVNVDLFGEGVDVPSIAVVSFARPTKSYGLYVQQFGRGLRVLVEYSGDWGTLSDADRLFLIAMSDKPNALIIDHVNNVVTHGLPDTPRIWSLARGERRASGIIDGIPVRSCPNCTAVYERIHWECPECGFHPIPTARLLPTQVDGDLFELSPETLAVLRGDVDRVDMHPEAYRAELAGKYVPMVGQLANVKRHVRRQEYQAALRISMAWWAGFQRAAGRTDSESYRLFYWAFGIDVLSAQSLGTNEAETLANRINVKLGGM